MAASASLLDSQAAAKRSSSTVLHKMDKFRISARAYKRLTRDLEAERATAKRVGLEARASHKHLKFLGGSFQMLSLHTTTAACAAGRVRTRNQVIDWRVRFLATSVSNGPEASGSDALQSLDTAQWHLLRPQRQYKTPQNSGLDIFGKWTRQQLKMAKMMHVKEQILQSQSQVQA
eukprot:jgi/Chlat1/6093/Chrsp40S05683